MFDRLPLHGSFEGGKSTGKRSASACGVESLPGVMTAIWSRVQNFRFYDYQVFVTSDPAVSPDWSTLPIGNNTVTQITTEAHPVGSLMFFRVRTVSSKGPGPWSDALSGLVL